MPPQLSSELALQPKGINVPSVGCDRFGLKMTNRPALEAHRSLLPGRLAALAMCQVPEWFLLLQNFSGALMTALLMRIPRGADRRAAAAPLEKGKRAVGGREALGRERSRLGDGEKPDRRADRERRLSRFRSWPQEEVEKLDLEGNTVPCGIRPSISLDFGSDSETSSDKDPGMEEAECPGGFPQSLGIGKYFEHSCRPHEQFGDSDSRESVERPSLSRECQESIKRSRDFPRFGKQSVASASGCASEVGEYPSQEDLGAPPRSHGFQSPLVLSLFYSPSEEEEEDSGGWSSEDEMEETSQSYSDGGSSSAAEDNSRHQGFPENLCGPACPNTDPWRSPCVSGSIQLGTFDPPEPKKHKEITVSLRLGKPDSKLEELCNPPKPSSSRDQSSATGHPPHRCCQLEMERNHDAVSTEASFGSQKETQGVKKVRFSLEVTVHRLVLWDYASRAARRGPWEEMARDRCRFQRRIVEVGAVLEPCLETGHRAKVWRKIHRAPDGPCLAGTR